ncbi:sugar ABC transporter substrate-binding protein [Chelativorans sp.]|uniref:ABC transporter substrate-binding protein n=1 Tax=Chelativorans sp. TaxID=2203393 RepID=UPI002811658C|nr:sugar ABC transporter substrate-binding protein [Chelativorans sp.]
MSKNGTWKTSAAGIALAVGMGMSPAMADNVVLWVNSPLASAPDAPIYEELQAFEAETGHAVEVQPVAHMEMERNLFVALSGGAGPDVMALDIAWVAGLADAGLLADLTEKSEPLAAQFQKGPFASGRFEQKQYALPLYTNNVALFVNDKMLAEAGIEKAPTNWDEFRQAAIAMTDEEKGTYGLTFGGGRMGAFQLYSYIWQNGGDIIDTEGNVRVGEAGAVGAVDFLGKLYTEDKAMPEAVLTAGSWDEVNAPFIQERAGMLVSGDWAISALKNGNPDLDWSVHPLPAGKEAATVIGGYDLAINANSSVPDASWQLVEWLTGPRGVELMRKYNRLSAAAGATAPEAIASLPEEMRPFMEQADAGRARPVVAQWSQIHNEIIANAWDSVLRGTPAQEAMAEADKQIKALVGQQ